VEWISNMNNGFSEASGDVLSSLNSLGFQTKQHDVWKVLRQNNPTIWIRGNNWCLVN